MSKYNASDYVGQRFGHLILISDERHRINGNTVFKCLCDCGNECYKKMSALVGGTAKTCGKCDIAKRLRSRRASELNSKRNREENKKTIVATSSNGKFKFKSYNHAAGYFNVSENTIKNRISKSEHIGGYRLTLEQPENCNDIPLAKEISLKTRAIKADKDTEIDLDVYIPIKYEVRYGRISITKCPYKYDDKPFVGSARCASCGSFRGRNRQQHLVACYNSRKE